MPVSAGLEFTFAFHYIYFSSRLFRNHFNVSKRFANNNALYIIVSSPPFLLWIKHM